jgi:hypothetical protein
MRQVQSKTLAPKALTALGLAMVSTMACFVSLLLINTIQILKQRPAFQGLIVIHLSSQGELWLWNQQIRPQELPLLMERLRIRRPSPAPTVVRLVPERGVPWGVVHQVLERVRPIRPADAWSLQLQLP